MNDNAEIPNPALRAHVTDHSFVLALRKTHIAGLSRLVHEDVTIEERVAADMARRKAGGPEHMLDRHFIVSMRGLQDRGMVEHRHHPNFRGKMGGEKGDRLSDYYRLTRAGWAAFDLLVEAGLAEPVVTKRRKVA